MSNDRYCKLCFLCVLDTVLGILDIARFILKMTLWDSYYFYYILPTGRLGWKNLCDLTMVIEKTSEKIEKKIEPELNQFHMAPKTMLIPKHLAVLKCCDLRTPFYTLKKSWVFTQVNWLIVVIVLQWTQIPWPSWIPWRLCPKVLVGRLVWACVYKVGDQTWLDMTPASP